MCIVPMMSLAQNYKSVAWCPDNGDGTYTNPVINADYSDPDAIAVGEDYFLTASSFASMPGLPILHSKDMVNWEIINYALQSQFPDSDAPQHGNGVWAPCLRYHNGEYFIYWGDPDNGVMMVKTKDPYGKWDDPGCVIPGKGMIDTTPLWDDDGRCYLANGWAGSRSGFNSMLTVRELSADGTRAIGNPVIVYDGGNANHTAEGPKFYKRDGWYWIMCPAGGVETGWQLAMRSKSPYGPYECKMVMAQGNSTINGPHQGAWVHTAFGEDWFLHFQDKGCYGRVVHLQPVTWKDNWPVMGTVPKKGYCGEPVITHTKPKTAAPVAICNPVESDEFNAPHLGLQWQWAGDYNQLYGMPTADGFFRLYCYKLGTKDAPVNLWKSPALLLQKTPADEFTASAKVRFAAKGEQQYGGIIMMGMDYSALVVRRVGDAFELQQLICKGADKGRAETVTTLATFKPTEVDKINYAPAIYEDIYLRMMVKGGKCRFAYSTNGKSYKEVGDEFTMREGRWIGAKIGLVAAQPTDVKGNKGFLDIDWFRVGK